mmetsp:Transcript_108575/g.291545  ORF Transcript_108575/g.291545 Transcript_108575/m.291545 type:complete len:244 (-) Transcript_108575:3-734(-)
MLPGSSLTIRAPDPHLVQDPSRALISSRTPAAAGPQLVAQLAQDAWATSLLTSVFRVQFLPPIPPRASSSSLSVASSAGSAEAANMSKAPAASAGSTSKCRLGSLWSLFQPRASPSSPATVSTSGASARGAPAMRASATRLRSSVAMLDLRISAATSTAMASVSAPGGDCQAAAEALLLPRVWPTCNSDGGALVLCCVPCRARACGCRTARALASEALALPSPACRRFISTRAARARRRLAPS